jgi:hypothetical protein
MQLQTISPEGEASPARRRTRKSHWRRLWITMTNGATLDRRAIGLRRPKLIATTAYSPAGKLANKFTQRPRSAESEFGLKFELRKPGPLVARESMTAAEKRCLEHLMSLPTAITRMTKSGAMETRTESPSARQGVFFTQDKESLRRRSRSVKFDKIGTT